MVNAPDALLTPPRQNPDEEAPPAALFVVMSNADESAPYLYTLHIRAALSIADRLMTLYRGADASIDFPVVPNANGEAISRLHFGSPLEFVAPLLAASSPVWGLAALIYAVKRVWGLDLELRTHRERLRGEFMEAQRVALEAEQRLSESPFKPSAHDAVEELQKTSAESGWTAQQAIIFDQEDNQPER